MNHVPRKRSIAFFLLLVCLAVSLSGCGERLEGRYEAVHSFPKIPLFGLDRATQQKFNDQFKAIQDMSRTTMEFDGSIVRLGTSAMMTECAYRVKGNQLEVTMNVNGQKAIMPMTIQDDGSITYLTTRFRKVD